MPRDEARRRARLQFGRMARFGADRRDGRWFGLLEDAVHDARFAVRGLVSQPSFSVAALLALAIGIGAATAIYSLADHILLRPVPGVRAPHELVTVLFERESHSRTGISNANLSDLEAGDRGEVAQISELNEVVLPYLDKMGIRPGARVFVKDLAPLEGPVTVETDQGVGSLGRELAALVRVIVA
jgi:Fe2+ transport system protein FeoA